MHTRFRSLLAAIALLPCSAFADIVYNDGDFVTGYTLLRPGLFSTPATLRIDSGTATQAGVLYGNTDIAKTGAGTLILSAVNEYNGWTYIYDGTLALGTDGALPQPSIVTLYGGTLSLGNFSQTVDSISLREGTAVTGTGGVLSVKNGIEARGASISAIIDGEVMFRNGDASTPTVLTGNNLYTGGTTSQGILQIGDGGTSGSLGSGGVMFSGTLRYNRSDTLTESNVIQGYGSLQHVGTGTLILTGNNTYLASTFVSVGTLQIGNGGASGSLGGTAIGYGDVTVNGALVFDRTGLTEVFNNISGTGSVTFQNAAGELRLLGQNTYSGGTSVSAGSLVVTADNQLPVGGDITVSGGTLNLGPFSQSAGDVSLTAGNIAGTSGTLTGTAFNLESGTVSARLAGTGALTKTGPGTVTLTNTNTYSGGTTVTEGSLVVSTNNNHLPVGGNLTVNGGTFNLGSTSQSVGTVSLTSGTIAGTGTLSGSAFNLEAGTVSAHLAGTGALTKTGPGTVTLTNTNTYSGDTTVNAGSLGFSADNLLPVGGNLTVNGGTFNLGSTSQSVGAVSLTSGTIAGTGTLSGSAFNLEAGTVSAHLGGSGALTKTGPGTVTLANTNTYSGGTIVNGGVLQIDADSRLGSGGLTLNGGGLAFAASFNDLRAFTVGADGGTLDTQGFNVGTIGAITNPSGMLTKTGPGRLSVAGGLTGAGKLTISEGTLSLNSYSTAGPVILENGILAGSGTLTGTSYDIRSGTVSLGLAGTAGLFKSGAGTATLTGANTYTGGTSIIGGTLVGNTASLQGNITNLSTLIFDQASNGTYAGQIGGTGSLTKIGDGTLILSGANNYSGITAIDAGTLQIGNGGTTGSLGSSPIINNSSLAFNRSNALSIANAISGAGSLTKIGDGTLTLAGANSYTGGTFVNAGTLQVGITDQDNVLPTTGAVTVNGGTLSFPTSTIQTIGPLTLLSGTISASNVSRLIPTSVVLESGSLTARLYGSTSVVKNGAGTADLVTRNENNNTYSGGTFINEGTLRVSGSGPLGTGHVENNASLEFFENAFYPIDNSISGTGSVTKTGTGSVQLQTGTLTYTGGTFINQGRLISSTPLPAGGDVTVNGGTFEVGKSQSVGTVTLLSGSISGDGVLTATNFNVESGTISATLAGTGALTKTGSGTVTLSGYTHNFYGPTTISAGTLALGDTNVLGNSIVSLAGGTLGVGNLTTVIVAGLSGSGSLTLNNNSSYPVTLRVGNNGQWSWYSGELSGTGSLVKIGFGVFVLEAANTFSGTTTLEYGTLKVSHPLALQNSTLIFNDSHFVFGEIDEATLGGLAGDRSFALNNESGDPLALIVGNNNASTGYSGTLSGNGSLIKIGTGTLSLSGSQSYAGATTVAGGTLRFNNANQPDHSGRLTVAADATLELNYIYTRTFGSLTGAGNITNGGYLRVGSDHSDFEFSGVISGTGSLTKTGTGILTLSGANTYEGGTTITGGLIEFSDFDHFGSGTVTLNGGGLRWAAGNTTDVTSEANFNRTIGNAGATFDTNGNNITFAQALGGAGSLTKSGAGSLTFSAANSYSGGTFINGGTLIGDTTTLHGNITTNATLAFDQTNDGTFAGKIDGSGALTKNGSGALTLTGANSYSGGTTINAGSLIGDTTSLQGNITNHTALVFDQDANGTYTGVISGAGTLTKTGAGTLTLDNYLTYSGATTINAGTLEFGGAEGGTWLHLSGAPTGDITVNDGGTLRFSRNYTFGVFSATTTPAITINAGGLVTNGATFNTLANLTLAGGTLEARGGAGPGYHAYHLKGTVTATGAVTSHITAPGDVNALNQIQIGDHTDGGTTTFSVEHASGSLAIHAALIDALNLPAQAYIASGLVKTGAGSLILTGANTYSGGTTINAGSLIGNATSLQGDITNHAALVFDQNTNGTYAGVIDGTGTLTKIGTGTLTLTGANTYTGGTVIGAGELSVSANENLGHARGAVDVTGGTLRSTGTFTASRTTTLGAGGGTFDVTAGNTLTWNGDITGDASSLTKAGDGTLILGGSNSYTGGTKISAGTLVLDHANALGSTGTITFAGGRLQFTANNTNDYSDRFSTTGSKILDTNGQSVTLSHSFEGDIIKYGAGTLTLNATNSFASTIDVHGGTFAFGPDAALPNNDELLVRSGATLTFERNNVFGDRTSTPTTGLLHIATGGLVTSGNHFTVFGDIELNGELRATGGLGVTSDGVFGAYQLKGTVYNTLAPVGSITSTDAPYSSIMVGDGTVNGATTFILSNNQIIISAPIGNAVSIDAPVAVPSGITLGSASHPGSGTVILTSMDNTFNGTTTINPGYTLQIGDGGYTGSMSDGAIVNNGSLVVHLPVSGLANAISGTGSLTVRSGFLSLAGNNTYSGGTTIDADSVLHGTTNSIQGDITNNGTLLYFQQDHDGTYAGVLSGSGPLSIDIVGTLTFTGNNTYTGRTSLTSGALSVAANENLGSANAPVSFYYGSTLRSTGTFTAARATTLGIGGGTFEVTSGHTLTWNGDISGNTGYNLNKVGAGTLVLGGNNSYVGTTVIGAGVLSVSANENLGHAGSHVTLSGGTLRSTATFTSARATMLGTGGGTFDIAENTTLTWNGDIIGYIIGDITGNHLNKFGEGTLVLGGNNSYAGNTVIGAGVLSVSANENLGDANASVSLVGGTLRSTGTFTAARATTLGTGGGTFDIAKDTTLTWNGNITGASGNDLNKSGEGALVLGGNNSYAGATNVNQGILRLGSATALSPNTTLHVADGATFEANDFQQTVAGLSGRGAVDIGSVGMTIETSSSSPSVFDGRFSGEGRLTVAGTGTLTLTGTDNSYTGETIVSSGTLRVTGDISSSSRTIVVDNGILAGTGTVGTLTIAAGGTVAPGNSPGTLFAGYTIFESGGTFALEIADTSGAAGTAYDLLSISGALLITATADNPFLIDVTSLDGLATGHAANFDSTADYSFTFLTTTDGIEGFASDKFSLVTDRFTNPFTGSWSVSLSNSGHNLTLNYSGASAIPEPSTYAAILGGIALLAAIARRRLRSARSCSCG